MDNHKISMKTNKRSTGFTLIELLVVISIIALLASVVLLALNGARLKSRDAKRVGDLRQLQIALELYFSDNSSYPAVYADSALSSFQPTWVANWPTFLSGYIPAPVVDPTNSGTPGYFYSYAWGYKPNGCSLPTWTGSKANYILSARLENYTDSPNGCTPVFSTNADNATVNYVVGQ